MKKLQTYFLMLVTALCCSTLTACVEKVYAASNYNAPIKEIVSKTYNVKDFHGIQAGGAYKVNFEQAPSYSVEVLSTQDMLDILEVENRGGMLTFTLTKSLRRWTADITVNVKGPKLDYLVVSGACHFNGGNVQMDSDATIEASGAAKVVLGQYTCRHLSVEQSGASHLSAEFEISDEALVENSGASKLTGSITADGMVRAYNSGASSLNMDIRAPRLILRNSGASGSKVYVECDKMELENSGASRVTLSGRANQLDTRNSGASKISYLNFNKD